MTNSSKFKKGQEVFYNGNEAVVRSVKWCVFARDYYYDVSFRNENYTNCGATTYENSQTLKAR